MGNYPHFDFIRETLCINSIIKPDIDDINENTPLFKGGLELNSLDFLRAIIHIENRLKIEIDYGILTITNFETVGDIAYFIQKYGLISQS